MQFTYAWQHCDATGSNCAVVPGSTFQAHPLEQADARSTVRVVVTARGIPLRRLFSFLVRLWAASGQARPRSASGSGT